MTSEQATALLKLLIASYPNAEITLETQVAYVPALSDLRFDRAMSAVTKLIATSKFFPTVAEIREAEQHLAVAEYMQRPQLLPPNLYNMVPRERHTAAQEMAERAAEIEAKHGGPTYWSTYLRQAADLYEENAKRSERGDPLLPLSSISHLTAALMRGLGPPTTRRAVVNPTHDADEDWQP